jgi:hypothetical protein
MKKRRKQQAVFSSIAGMEVGPSLREPVPPTADAPGEEGQEEILQLRPGPELPEPEGVPSEAPGAESTKFASVPPTPETAPPVPESLAVPPAEAGSPPAEMGLREVGVALQSAVAGLAEPETLPEKSEERSPSSLKLATDLDLGQVLVGDFTDGELTVANEGNHPCVLTDLGGLPAAGFNLLAPPGLPLTMTPAGSMILAVRFSPNSPGKKTARLSIRLGGQDGLVSEVQLLGEAVRIVTTPSGIYYSPVFNSLDMSFVYIASGSFVMGSPKGESGRNQDETQHEVKISRGFYLQSNPVTQAQWRALMGDDLASLACGEDNHPVADVSWHECQDFIKRLNRLGEGVYRLPTEAEWEYACRAGGGAALGDRVLTALFCEKDAFLDEVAWYCGNSDRHAHPVALKKPNAWELCDMYGNVMEWCHDWYGEYPAAAIDPVGVRAGAAKVIRGGSWFSSAKNCRAAYRFKLAPDSRSHYVGFRLVKEP